MPLRQTQITAWVKFVRFDAYDAQPFRARKSKVHANDMPILKLKYPKGRAAQKRTDLEDDDGDSSSIDYSWASSALGGWREDDANSGLEESGPGFEESDATETGPAPASDNGSPAINIVNLFGNVNVGSGSRATINAGSGSRATINVVNDFGQINVG